MWNFRENKKSVWLALISVLLVLVVGAFDYGTGPAMEFGVVYLVPILLASTINTRFGLVISFVGASVGLLTDFLLAHHHVDPAGYLWDFCSHMAIYSVVAFLRSRLIQARQYERELARTDSLTGAMNARAFYEKLDAEIYLAGRRKNSLAIAYMDVDNFKAINDEFGHSTGDRLLCAIVTTIKKHIRLTDALARLGGDEFALLFPETDRESAQITMTRIQRGLLDEVQRNNWTVTFSIGVLLCDAVPATADELVKRADELMYSVKGGGKNAIKYANYAGY